jgi:hypothetical protein
MPKEAIDITPADSAVPVFLEEPTDEEIAERQAQHEVQEEARVAKEAAHESALEKLAALGLTEEEIQAIIGGI